MLFKARSRILRLTAALLAVFTSTAAISGCHRDVAELKIIGDTFYYDPDKLFDYESYFAELEAQAQPDTYPIIVPPPDTGALSGDTEPTTESDAADSDAIPLPAVTVEVTETDAESVQTAEIPVTNTVYWVKDGEVWHISEKCPSLARSKTILSGTVDAAMASGKARVCKRCGN